jgi:hypothetical protein
MGGAHSPLTTHHSLFQSAQGRRKSLNSVGFVPKKGLITSKNGAIVAQTRPNQVRLWHFCAPAGEGRGGKLPCFSAPREPQAGKRARRLRHFSLAKRGENQGCSGFTAAENSPDPWGRPPVFEENASLRRASCQLAGRSWQLRLRYLFYGSRSRCSATPTRRPSESAPLRDAAVGAVFVAHADVLDVERLAGPADDAAETLGDVVAADVEAVGGPLEELAGYNRPDVFA